MTNDVIPYCKEIALTQRSHSASKLVVEE